MSWNEGEDDGRQPPAADAADHLAAARNFLAIAEDERKKMADAVVQEGGREYIPRGGGYVILFETARDLAHLHREMAQTLWNAPATRVSVPPDLPGALEEIAAAHGKSIDGRTDTAGDPYPRYPQVGPLAHLNPTARTHVTCPKCGFTGRALEPGERDRRTAANDPRCPGCARPAEDTAPTPPGVADLWAFTNREGTALAELDLKELGTLTRTLLKRIAEINK